MPDRATATLADLLDAALALTAAADDDTAARLEATVVRPLRTLAEPADDVPAGPGPIDLAALARALTEACADRPPAALLEAAAGAQYLAGPGVDATVPGGPRLTVVPDGPYVLTGETDLTDGLGRSLAGRSVVALCRCGASGSKPWCDGTHATNGFSGAKRSDRVPDHLDSYTARQFDVHDNRGLCAHSGRCTDALPTAFRVGQEPFVAPAGGRADDILRAVQNCPSGALGAALAATPDSRELIDTARPPAIEVSQDGPYRITGGIDLVEGDGAPVARPAGASLEHYSLCRCGQSANKPFCSGAHWHADFHDPLPSDEPTLFEWAGGYPALLRMTRIFYERFVPEEELLAPLFARMEPDHPERVAAWLSEVFGGPDLYSERYGSYARMISQHVGKHLTEEQRARWVALLARSADVAGMPHDPEFRAAFVSYLEWGSRIAVENSQQDAHPPEGMPIPHWWWVCNATPAARISAIAPEVDVEQAPADTPGPDEQVSFDRHVKGLFRARDRGSMRFAFDLWSAADVRTHAEAILGRLREGSMPCDGAWPAEQVEVFQRWVDGGTAD